MASCPQCSATLSGEFGMVTCSECGAICMLDENGEVQSATASPPFQDSEVTSEAESSQQLEPIQQMEPLQQTEPVLELEPAPSFHEEEIESENFADVVDFGNQTENKTHPHMSYRLKISEGSRPLSRQQILKILFEPRLGLQNEVSKFGEDWTEIQLKSLSSVQLFWIVRQLSESDVKLEWSQGE